MVNENWNSMYDDLVEKAINMRKFAYAPYSKFTVGAALMAWDGTVFTGCNIENAAYSVCNCAERTALFKGVSEGYKDYRLIVIVGAKADVYGSDLCTPCGMCRQALREFCNPEEFKVICVKTDDDENVEDFRIYTLDELLVDSFGPENLH